ncbi:hypothetical protein [Pseudomonas synxantha]|uniref:hypothetical protein n=1 Tax=Pseudomonas synxantha TaxID=47883 RepID=UPI001179EA4C|nr:hypothetical protein [Pseudomonas synxantha]
MSINLINIGSAPNSDTGQDLRSGGAVINANFQDLDQRVDSKQAASAKLNALAAADYSSQSFPVFTNNNSSTAQPISDEGLLLVRQTSPEGMRTRLHLTPVTSSLDEAAGRLLTPGWMGLGTRAGNRLPGNNAQQALASGDYACTGTWEGSPYAGVDGRNQGILSVKVWDDIQYSEQTFRPLRRSNGPLMQRNSFGGVWNPWQIVLTGMESQTSDTMNAKLQMRNVLGLGVPHTYCINIDGINSETSLVLGYSYVSQNTAGTKPPGYVYGVVHTVCNASDHVHQEFVGLNGVPGVTQRAYRRSGYGTNVGTAWGPWRLVVDSASAEANLDVGGIMYRTVISGIAVTKFSCGLQIVNGNFGATDTIPAGGYTIVNLTVPVNTGPDVSYTTTNIIASPYVTNDWFGITNAYMSSPTNLQLVVRNGATPQQFGVRGVITGHWK